MTKACAVCGRDYTPPRCSRVKTCGPECGRARKAQGERERLRRARGETPAYLCSECGAPFAHTRASRGLTCSPECRRLRTERLSCEGKRRRYRERHGRRPSYVCSECRRPFAHTWHSQGVVCSDGCRRARHRRLGRRRWRRQHRVRQCGVCLRRWRNLVPVLFPRRGILPDIRVTVCARCREHMEGVCLQARARQLSFKN